MLLAVAKGLSNQEVAAQLHLGYGTVKTHVSHLLTKLECRDRAQLSCTPTNRATRSRRE